MKHTRTSVSSRATGKGYSLVEIIIALSLLSMAMVGIMGFSTESARNLFVNEQKNMINRDIRMVTARMSDDARQSNYFLIYRSFKADDRENPGDRRSEGLNGDFMVLVYQGIPAIEQGSSGLTMGPVPTERIVGYYRSPGSNDPSSLGPVRRFDIAITGSNRFKAIEELLPSESLASTHMTVLELSQGLADGRLFYNYRGLCVMINGKIVHGVSAKRITDTYNFTIAPRG